MKLLATALAAGILIASTASTYTPSTATSTYTASFKVAQTVLPGDASSLDFPTANSWGFNSYFFFEVSIPTFPADTVELDEQMEGDQIPVLTFTPNEGWTRIEENTECGVWKTVWFYSFPVASGDTFLPLFDEWRLTNFRVVNGVCGEHTYSEIIEAANEASITHYRLQADGISGEPAVLWGMVK